ncbi:MAG: hypothetical protein F4Y82_05860 [Cenarchaeum sp. SB0665_bin_23]|nr:hypothetical protein [Cenarchaeum sp. SB0665_bin_23]MYB47614.1 hypothetical protein [Cenarchaeum sp. SB0662_bin_33]MYG33108.1 hypothetical protein [Cenarchaeum sp. SB0677_bin_16]
MVHQVAVAAALAISAVVAVALTGMVTEVSGENIITPTAPRYSETCAHGHNGFNCGDSSLRQDIGELERRVSILEQ